MDKPRNLLSSRVCRQVEVLCESVTVAKSILYQSADCSTLVLEIARIKGDHLGPDPDHAGKILSVTCLYTLAQFGYALLLATFGGVSVLESCGIIIGCL